MESQPQNPEFRINPENFHPWSYKVMRNFPKANFLLKLNDNMSML